MLIVNFSFYCFFFKLFPVFFLVFVLVSFPCVSRPLMQLRAACCAVSLDDGHATLNYVCLPAFAVADVVVVVY